MNATGYNLWQDSDMRLSLPLLLCDIFTGEHAEQKAAVAVYLLEKLIRNDDFEEMTRLLDEPKKSIALEADLRKNHCPLLITGNHTIKKIVK